VTAAGVFLLLFSGAWILDPTEDVQVNPAENSVNIENVTGLINVTNNSQIERMSRKPFIKFQPREYVRIEQR
jgi:hypothetical protein